MQNLTWYVNRLSRMSPQEMGYRARNVIVGRLERLGMLGASNPPAADPRRLPPWIFSDPTLDASTIAASADRILENRYPIFGMPDGTDGSALEWNRDPFTGTIAPLAFGKTLDYRSEAITGNIKYLWEPNRHLELVTLAQAYNRNGNRRYLDGIRQRVMSWMQQCPYPLGPNWVSSLELGIRLINWSIVWDLLDGLDSPLFSGSDGVQFRDQWLASIYQHVHFINGHYSKFSSANNHIIGEAAGIYVATSVWAFWPDFEPWRERARKVLLAESKKQTHADGVNKEQAVSYQQFVLDFLLFAGLAGERCQNDTFPDEYWLRIEAMIGFIASLMDVSGNMPMIGDADDGYVSRLAPAGSCPFRSLLATGAVRFGRPDFAQLARAFDHKSLTLLGSAAGSKFEELLTTSTDAPEPVMSFAKGGYFILGTGFGSREEMKAVVDCGPLGYLSIAAHGHADALSMTLSVSGREILVDPGTYSYHTDRLWRDYFRGTRAHNTVCVDGNDQSRSGGNFMWIDHANSILRSYSKGANEDQFSGEHTGYRRLRDPVTHRRSIHRRGKTIRITDELYCEDNHKIERCWHFSENCDVMVEGLIVVVRNGEITVSINAENTETSIRCARGSENPPEGWISRSFDVKVPAYSVFFSNEIAGSSTFTTSIQLEEV